MSLNSIKGGQPIGQPQPANQPQAIISPIEGENSLVLLAISPDVMANCLEVMTYEKSRADLRLRDIGHLPLLTQHPMATQPTAVIVTTALFDKVKTDQ